MNEFFKALTFDINIKDEGIKKMKQQLSAPFDKFGQDISFSISSAFENSISSFVKAIKSVFSGALDRLEEMTSYAFMTDSSVRDMKLGYGLSSSQAYGLSQALNVMGFGSMEDLMWADSQQLSLFRNAFEKYSKYYESTMTPEYISKQLEFQTEMKMFRMTMEHEIAEFFMEHKDLLIKFMEVGMTFFDTILSFVDRLTDIFSTEARSNEQRTRDAESILTSYTTHNKSNTVSFTNNFNAANSDTSQFANITGQIYRQVIAALNGGKND